MFRIIYNMKFQKGSAEAKEHMAKIRSMRKGGKRKSGGSLSQGSSDEPVEEHREVELYLNPGHLRKLKGDKTFQLSHQQLQGTDGNKVYVHLHHKHHKKLLTNVSEGRGFRFTPEIVRGSGFWDGVKKGWNKVKEVGAKAGEFVKNVIPPELMKAGLTAAATAAGTAVGNPELGLLAAPVINKGVDYGYATKKKSLKEHAKELKNLYKDEIEEGRKYAKKHHKDLYEKVEKYSPYAETMYNNYQRHYNQPAAPPPISSDYQGYTGGRGILEDGVKAVRRTLGVGLKKRGRRKGKGFFDDIKKTFTKDLPSSAIHVGIPAVGTALGGLAGAAAAGGIGGIAGSVAGNAAGTMIADRVGKETGYGFLHTKNNRIANPDSRVLGGVPTAVYRKSTVELMTKHGIGHRNRKNNLKIGGSFLEMGGH
jgi:hypothetical protein